MSNTDKKSKAEAKGPTNSQALLSSADPAKVSGADPAKAVVTKSNYSVNDERRRFPEGRELLKPAHWFHWSLGLLECWAFSRRYGRLLAGLPFLVALAGGVGFVWWLRHASDAPVLAAYEAGVNLAIRDGDTLRQENYLTALVELRPREPQYRFRLGMFLVESGRPEGLSHILDLAPDNTDGYPEARLWLVQQARSAEPVLPLNEQQIEGQLLRLLRNRPSDAEIHRQLAEIYVRKSEFSLAEDHLTQAARTIPELHVELAQLKKALNRPADDVKKMASQGVAALSERLAANRDDSSVRIALAQAQLLLDQESEARSLLVAGLKQQDDPKLRRALSDFDLMLVERRLETSILNRDACTQIVVKTLEIDPSNVNAVQSLTKLSSLGAKLTPEQIAPAVEYWQQQQQQQADSDETAALRILSQLYSVSGQHSKAVETLAPLVDQDPKLRVVFARMLLQAGESATAMGMLEQMLQENSVQPVAIEANLSRLQSRTELLLLSSRPEEACEMLRTAIQAPEADARTVASLSPLLGQSCLTVYDKHVPPKPAVYTIASTTEISDEALLTLLTDAIQVQATAAFAIDRMARLSMSDHSAAEAAEDILVKLRARQDPNGIITNLLGTHALQAEDYERARRYLTIANAQSGEKQPMIMNNLAVALIRSEPVELERAMELVNKALEITNNNPDMLATRAEVHVARKDWTSALGDLNLALQVQSNNRDIHLLLHKVNIALDQPKVAEEHRRIADSLGGS